MAKAQVTVQLASAGERAVTVTVALKLAPLLAPLAHCEVMLCLALQLPGTVAVVARGLSWWWPGRWAEALDRADPHGLSPPPNGTWLRCASPLCSPWRASPCHTCKRLPTTR